MIDLDKIKPIAGDKRRYRLLTLVLIHLVLTFMATALRLVFLFMFKDQDSHWPEIIQSMGYGLLFDLRATCIVLLPQTLLIFIPRTFVAQSFWMKLLNIVQGIIILGYFIVFAADFGHYNYLKWRINSSILDVLENSDISTSMVFQTYPIFSGTLVILFLTLVCMLAIEWIKRKYYYRGNYQLVYFPYRFERCTWFLIILPLLYGKISYFPLRWSDAFHSTNNFTNQLGLNPLMSFIESLERIKTTYDLKKIKEYYPIISQYLGVTDPDVNTLNFKRNFQFAPDAMPKPHLIFIQMESMAYDKSSMSDNPLDPTPELKKIAAEGLYFSHFYTPTEATARGVFATLTGIPDVTYDKSSSRNPLTSKHDLIFNQLIGYEKYYFLGGSANWGNIRGLWQSNIQNIHIHDEGSWKAPRIDVWGISDLDLFKESLNLITQLSVPTLSYIQTAGFHRPYTIPKDHGTFVVRKDFPVEKVKEHGFLSLEEYNSIRLQDYALGQFWEALKHSNLYPNVIVAIYGDHGLPSDKSLHVPAGHYQHRVVNHHVPLVIVAPGRVEPKVITDVIGSMVDIVPTVMSLAKINFYTRTFGRDLLSPRAPENNAAFLFSFHEKPKHVSMIDSQFLWVNSPSEKKLYLYESDDPRQDVSAEHTEVKNRFENLADGIFETAKYMLYNNHN